MAAAHTYSSYRSHDVDRYPCLLYRRCEDRVRQRAPRSLSQRKGGGAFQSILHSSLQAAVLDQTVPFTYNSTFRAVRNNSRPRRRRALLVPVFFTP